MRRALALLLGALACSLALAQDRTAAGSLDFVEGDSIIESKDGEARIAKTGDAVYETETITTFAGAEVHVAMADGAHISVRENTKVTISVYVANGDDGDRSLLDLAKGTLRSVTGWIGKYRRAAYQIRTPMVTIGVRGTDHEPTHLPPGDPRGEPGSYDKVNEGRTVMQSEYGSVEVPPNRAAHFSAERRVAPRVLASVPSFFKPAKNEQRFVQRARESVRTIDAQREARRNFIQKRQAPKAAPKPAAKAQKPAAESRMEKKASRLEKKAARVEKKPFRPEKKAERSFVEKPRLSPPITRKDLPRKSERFEKKKKQ